MPYPYNPPPSHKYDTIKNTNYEACMQVYPFCCYFAVTLSCRDTNICVTILFSNIINLQSSFSTGDKVYNIHKTLSHKSYSWILIMAYSDSHDKFWGLSYPQAKKPTRFQGLNVPPFSSETEKGRTYCGGAIRKSVSILRPGIGA